ncbi:MAG: hypothetical protein FWG68_02055 [Defluviitaleaceae bacterium]|nr:hypothetical protein [Defluviitaleaceae bacterium]
MKNNPTSFIGYSLAMLLLPNIFLLFLYNNNTANANFRLDHISILAAFLAIISLALFWGLRKISQNNEGAFLSVTLFWVLFWFFERIYGIVVQYSAAVSREMLLAACVFAAFACVGVIRRYEIGFEKIRPVFTTLVAMVYVLFAFNALPLLQTAPVVVLAETPEEDKLATLFRQEFNVDPTLPSPDIFWFHADGALSFAAVERFFGDPQNEFRAELQNRGFVINENAIVNAGATWPSLPTLLSPGFYDNYWGELLVATNHTINTRRRNSLIRQQFAQDGIVWDDDPNFPYQELYEAFMAAGYNVAVQGHPSQGFVPTASTYFYNISNEQTPLAINHDAIIRNRHPFLLGLDDLVDLMIVTTPFSIIEDFLIVNLLFSGLEWISIPSHSEQVERLIIDDNATFHERALFRNLLEALELPSPKLVYTQPWFWHRSQWAVYTDSVDPEDPFELNQYMVAHNHGVEVLLTMIDLILERNPNAIIVVQSDHGFHIWETQLILESMGFSDEERFEMIHATLSAVRIPPQYGGLDEPLNPKNITRELVNRFVGVNYELLP